MSMNLPVPRTTILSICKARDTALAKMTEAAELLEQGFALSKEARFAAQTAHGGARAQDPHDVKHQQDLNQDDFDPTKSLVAYRKALDANIWTNLMAITGMGDMMDKTAKDQFRHSLLDDVPEASEENIAATLQGLFANADLIFQRGLAKAFSGLDKRFKSHDGFQIGSRMIIERLFNEWGDWNGYGNKDNTLQDVERVFAVLDKEKPDFWGLREAISTGRRGHGARQSETEAAYFRVKGFKNGNAHLWFTRDDLVEKANKLLAEYYGATLPDAATVNEKPTGTAVSTKLQFYGTPPEAVRLLLKDIYFKPGMKILEPSAGEGAIVRAIPSGMHITAIEFDARRADYSQSICANFLTYPLPNTFDLVLMNPPFAGLHYQHHVRKAFSHLRPGGLLRSILPASAEVNETKAHLEFRTWAAANSKDTWRQWTALPPESFATSGTKIQTVILEMKKP